MRLLRRAAPHHLLWRAKPFKPWLAILTQIPKCPSHLIIPPFVTLVWSIRITQIEDTTATLSLQMTKLRQYMQLVATHVVPQAILPTPTLGGNPINNDPPLPRVDNASRPRARADDVENSIRSSASNSHSRSNERSRRE